MTKSQFKCMNAQKIECIPKILHVEQSKHCVDLGSKIYSRERKDKIVFLAQCVLGFWAGGAVTQVAHRNLLMFKLLNHLRTVS